MRIGMIGSGYVGLVSGTCFAEFGHDVTCVDIDAQKIAQLQAGQIPIYEPGLQTMVTNQVAAGRLTFTTDFKKGVHDKDAVFIAVPTPSQNDDANSGQADLSYVFEAARQIARSINGYTVIVDKSTVPVGTARLVQAEIRATNPNAIFDVASNPEFLREGSAIEDFMRPDRVVIGTDTNRAATVMESIYRPLSLQDVPVLTMSLESAEMSKYAANGFLATKVTFINEIARLCEAAGGDIQDIARAIGLDHRIGEKFLQAGPGIGGSCFPKDTRALMQTGRDFNAPQTVVEAVINANEETKKTLAARVIDYFGGTMAGKTVAVLGVAFKQQTDDMRGASALTMVPMWQAAGATVRAFDPVAAPVSRPLLPGVLWADDPYLAVAHADAVIILTEWNEFRGLDLNRLAGLMRVPVMFDYRNIYQLADMRATPFTYHSIGRVKTTPVAPKLRQVSA